MDSSIKSKNKEALLLPNCMMPVPTDFSGDFFEKWCIFLRPFAKLTDKETKIIASMLKRRWELSKTIDDPSVLDTLLMSKQNRDVILNECGITLSHFYVIMGKFRKNGIIVNGAINPKLIPNLKKGSNAFSLLILFEDKKHGS